MKIVTENEDRKVIKRIQKKKKRKMIRGQIRRKFSLDQGEVITNFKKEKK